jgi:hypothetical protein
MLSVQQPSNGTVDQASCLPWPNTPGSHLGKKPKHPGNAVCHPEIVSVTACHVAIARGGVCRLRLPCDSTKGVLAPLLKNVDDAFQRLNGQLLRQPLDAVDAQTYKPIGETQRPSPSNPSEGRVNHGVNSGVPVFIPVLRHIRNDAFHFAGSV